MKLRVLFCLVLLLCIGMRIFNLDKGYNSDEGWLVKAASIDLNKLIPYLKEGHSIFPPLSPFLLHFWMKINNTEVWVRGYFVIFGIILCILIYHLGKTFVDARFGLVAFFISSISPLLIWSSQFVRSYIDSAFWIILSSYFMLKIIKGIDFWRNAFGYIVSSSLASYSSHINILILAAQSFYISLFYLKSLNFFKKWISLQIIIAIIVMPSVFLFLKQIGLASGIDPKWQERGFQIFGLNIGYLTRSIVAICGIDPAFLTYYPLSQKLNKLILLALACLVSIITYYLFISALRGLKNIFNNNRLTWFFPTISLITLVLQNIAAEIFNFAINAKYYVAQHALFIPVISCLAYNVKKKNRINIPVLFLITIVYLFRFQEAIKPDFETKKAHYYLTENIKSADCLLIVRNTNFYIEPGKFNIVIMYGFLEKDSKGDNYKPLNTSAKAMLSNLKENYKDICFYRQYGNDEILGANRLLMDWLKVNGYKIDRIQQFRRIDIIHYKRLD